MRKKRNCEQISAHLSSNNIASLDKGIQSNECKTQGVQVVSRFGKSFALLEVVSRGGGGGNFTFTLHLITFTGMNGLVVEFYFVYIALFCNCLLCLYCVTYEHIKGYF